MENLKQTSKYLRFSQFTKMTIFVFSLLISITSCSTGSDDDVDDEIGDYKISFNANGVLQEFTSDHFPQGSVSDNGTQYIARFTGVRSSSTIQIEALDNKAIIKTSYSDYVITQATTQSLAFVVGASIAYAEGQTTYTTPSTNPNVLVTITEINSNSVRGTFSGTLQSNGKEDLVVTNGKFYVELI
jgi:hypothetical protein